MRKLGLIGKNISYSFSKSFFDEKFEAEKIIDATYENFDIENITSFPNIINENPTIKGLNVTIPYKELVIPYLDKLSKKAKKIGAVNTIKFNKSGKLIGYNTDCYGFKKAIKPHLKKYHKKALILGTGGASKAIAYALKKMNIKYSYVSRNKSNSKVLNYDKLNKEMIENHLVIINCTPLGTFPNIKGYPKIPYHAITQNHILFDLIYNPKQTQFLKFGQEQNATTINGLKMLEYQAEKSWEIWNS